MTETTALMICGQANPLDAFLAEFDALTRAIGEQLPGYPISSGLIGSPEKSVGLGIEKLIIQGATTVICVPGMLPTANLGANSVSTEIDKISIDQPNISFIHTRDMAIDSKMLAAARDCIEACEAAAAVKTKREDTLLMVVGKGSTDAEPNANVAKVARMLWEGMGFGWAEVSYADSAFPSVDIGLSHAVKLGFKSIIVFPYFLFSDKALDGIYYQADLTAKANPDIDVRKASHLNNHGQLIDCFVDRVFEAINGSNIMNCMKCAYREQVTGDPSHDHGHSQEHKPGHHHDHDHDHSHPHAHDHTHSTPKDD